jgi:hypothetical protein
VLVDVGSGVSVGLAAKVVQACNAGANSARKVILLMSLIDFLASQSGLSEWSA